MSECGDKAKATPPTGDPCHPPQVVCPSAASACADGPLAYFGEMIDHCFDVAESAKADGRPIVGIMCEYTPREVIMAAGGVPVCLCGGSADTIPPAEEHLPANLCPLIKSTFGYHVTKGNPFLEMADLIVAETTCDGKKKMYELMAESRPMCVLELPQRQDDPEAVDYWTGQVRTLARELEQRFGKTITDDDLRCAIATMNEERSLRRELAALMKADAPPLTGRQLLELKSSISGIPADLDQYRQALETLRAKEPDGALTSRVRVLLTGVPVVHGAERVVDLIEGHGGLIVCMENCTGLKPIIDDVDPNSDDPIRAIAEKYYHLPCSVMTPNDQRRRLLKQLADDYRPDCVIE
ncbi:MAG: 2-hydroxyacyl-CoA dehydratase, partial [Planctomycetota bacterium]